MRVSFHAAIKYVGEIWKNQPGRKFSLDEVREEIIEIYKKSEEEEMSAGLIIRMIENKFEDAKYYRYKSPDSRDVFRLVVLNNTIVTIERDNFKDTSLGYMKKKNLDRRK